MKKGMKQKEKTKTIAISQMMILIIGVFAFVYLVGEIPNVSAKDPLCAKEPGSIGCMATSQCTAQGGTPKAGLCGGPTDNQCCIKEKVSEPSKKIGTKDLLDAATPGLGLLIPSSSDAAKDMKEVVTVEKPEINDKNAFWSTMGDIGTIAATAASAVGFNYAFRALAKGIGANTDWTTALGAIGSGAGGAATLAILSPSLLSSISGILGVSTLATGFIIGGFIFIIAALFTSTTTEQGVVYYYCNQWQPASGGSNCKLCNTQEVPCSEYQCRSLGLGCNFVPSDPEQGGVPYCFWNNSNDIDPPVIKPNPDVLNINYIYTPDNVISPPDKGVKIVNKKSQDGCLSPFSKVTFGVTTEEKDGNPEPSQCKISFDIKDSYENMAVYMGGSSTLKFNHTQTLVIPELNSTIAKDNLISAYVRCQDANGNSEVGNFVFKMCVQEGPDVTPPYVESTSIKNDSRVAFNVTGAQVDFSINEPALCKWSFAPGRNFNNMEYNMTCSTDPTQINLKLGYTCSANLSGISSTEKTYYYVKCQDKPSAEVNDRNTMAQDYVYALSSSRALEIIEAAPNGTTISRNTDPAKVELTAKTIGGTYEGSAVCYWSTTGIYGEYTMFDNTSSYAHSTNVYIPASNPNPQKYYIRCDDLGGNADVVTINFDIKLDLYPPLISRAYYENGEMKIITSEEAECEYSTGSCVYQFGDGEKVPSFNQLTHLLAWDTTTDLHIKCQDIYGNQPAKPSECSIIVRAENKP